MADQAIPTFIHTDSKGDITYEFEGHIKADGIDLTEGGEPPETLTPASLLGWYTEITNILREYIVGSFPLTLTLFSGEGGSIPGDALLRLHSAWTNLDTAYIKAFINNVERVIYNSNAASHFAQLTTLAERKINRGESQVEWPASTQQSTIVTVSHGLGAIPQFVGATPFASEVTTVPISARIIEGSLTNTTFKVRLYCSVNVVAGTKLPFKWFAMS